MVGSENMTSVARMSKVSSQRPRSRDRAEREPDRERDRLAAEPNE